MSRLQKCGPILIGLLLFSFAPTHSELLIHLGGGMSSNLGRIDHKTAPGVHAAAEWVAQSKHQPLSIGIYFEHFHKNNAGAPIYSGLFAYYRLATNDDLDWFYIGPHIGLGSIVCETRKNRLCIGLGTRLNIPIRSGIEGFLTTRYTRAMGKEGCHILNTFSAHAGVAFSLKPSI